MDLRLPWISLFEDLQMRLTIILTKDVPDQAEGALLYEHVRDFVAQWPSVECRGTVTNHFELEVPDEPPT